MKFYIASSLSNKENVVHMANSLKNNGFIHTYDWTVNSNVDSIEKLAQIGELEKRAVLDADFFILVLPGGFGSHTELGMAIASGKRIYLYSELETPFKPEKTTTFYQIQGVNKFNGNFEQFIKQVISIELATR